MTNKLDYFCHAVCQGNLGVTTVGLICALIIPSSMIALTKSVVRLISFISHLRENATKKGWWLPLHYYAVAQGKLKLAVGGVI